MIALHIVSCQTCSLWTLLISSPPDCLGTAWDLLLLMLTDQLDGRSVSLTTAASDCKVSTVTVNPCRSPLVSW